MLAESSRAFAGRFRLKNVVFCFEVQKSCRNPLLFKRGFCWSNSSADFLFALRSFAASSDVLFSGFETIWASSPKIGVAANPTMTMKTLRLLLVLESIVEVRAIKV